MFLINMMNNIGGHAHLNPWQLNASMLAITAMGSLNGTVRRAALQSVQKTHLNVAYSIMVMPILYTLQGLESSGALPTLFKIGFYEVRPSIIAAFTIYSSLILTSAYRPQLMVNILQTVQEKTNPFLSWIEDGIARMRVRFFGGTQGYCKTMYKKEMKAAAGEQPPNATFEENL